MIEAANAATTNSQGFDPRAPYAEAWKEFDKLRSTMNDGPLIADYAALALAVLGAMVADLFAKPHFWLIDVAIPGLVAGVIGARVKRRKWRFEHWPCPRCRAEWPGNKYEKVPQCPSCGLKLHQVAP